MKWLITRDGVHTVIALGSLVAVGWGLHAIWWPLCPLVIGSLLLAAVVYARTRTVKG
jgi:hypothetical protein